MNKVFFMIALLFSLNTWANGECADDAQWKTFNDDAGFMVSRSSHSGTQEWTFKTPDSSSCSFATVKNNSKEMAYAESEQCSYEFLTITASGSRAAITISSLPGKNCQCVRSDTLKGKKPCTNQDL